MISHKHKCVFIHIPKCGGQSVEDIFIRDCGLTWSSREPLLLRRNDNEKVGPPRLAHLTYQEYLKYLYISQDLMDDYYKFAIVRNPFKRLESIYKFKGFNEAVSFEKFIMRVVPKEIDSKGMFYFFMKPQVDFLLDESGVLSVDKIVNLEELNESLFGVFKRLDISVNEIPHVNKSSRRLFHRAFAKRVQMFFRGYWQASIKVDSSIGWSDNMVEEVNKMYQEDFDLLGYLRVIE